MIKNLTFLLLLSSSLQAEHFDIFFLSGQSNASGRVNTGFVPQTSDADIPYWYRTDGPARRLATSNSSFETLGTLNSGYYGPEISAGRQLQSLGYNPAIIKTSFSSLNLYEDWNPNGGEWWNAWTTETANALNALTAAGHTYELQGYFWYQGESDGNENSTAIAYEDNFANFINATRDFLDEPELDFISALIRERTDRRFRPLVREGQINILESDVNGDYFDTNMFGVLPDNNHHNASGVNDVGIAFANTFEALQNSTRSMTDGTQSVAFPEPSSALLLGLSTLGFLGRRKR